MALKLRQGQVWKHGTEYIRIVELERLRVGFKLFKNIQTGAGSHHEASKKEFCRLLKNCTLMESGSALTTQPAMPAEAARGSQSKRRQPTRPVGF